MTWITKNKTVRRMLCGLLIVALAGGGIFYGLQSRQPEENTLAREQTVTRGDIVSSLTEEGTASVATQTTGLDLNVTVDDDTRLDLEVKVDDVLVRAGNGRNAAVCVGSDIAEQSNEYAGQCLSAGTAESG